MPNRLVALLILAVPLAASAQVAPRRTQLDSAKVADLLNRLRSADSAVCQLAGNTLVNPWNVGSLGDEMPLVTPMPRPMPRPMPMPFAAPVMMSRPGGRMRFSYYQASALGAFRAVLRDQSRCVRNAAAASDYRLSSIIYGIIESDPFGMRRSPEKP